MIDHLPRESYYVEAQADDEEFAEQVLALQEAAGEAKADRRPRLSEFDPVVERLTDLYDRLGDLTQAVIASAGVDPPRIKPAPRPETAAERLRKRRERQEIRGRLAWLEAQLLPDRTG